MIKFGPSGNSESFYSSGHSSTIEAPKWLGKLGLDLYEYPFTRGVNLSDENAKKMRDELAKYNITVTAHAPYYINLANPSEEMAQHSFKYIIDSLKKLKILGGKKLVVHTATQGKMTREEAISLCKTRLTVLKQLIHENDLDDMYVCLETMGKYSQIGTYQEIIDLCTISDNYMPTFDFGHINCIMQGGLKTEDDYDKIFTYCREKLGDYRTQNCHVHFSKIEFSTKGEVKHVTLDDENFGPEFEPFASYIIKHNITPTIVCESRNTQAQDALKMKTIYEKLKGMTK